MIEDIALFVVSLVAVLGVAIAGLAVRVAQDYQQQLTRMRADLDRMRSEQRAATIVQFRKAGGGVG